MPGLSRILNTAERKAGCGDEIGQARTLSMCQARPLSACLVAVSFLTACSENGEVGPRGGAAGVAAAGDSAGGAGGFAGLGAGGAGAAQAGTAGAAGTMVEPVGSDLGTITVESIATWRGDAQGAYTIIHDDIDRKSTRLNSSHSS